MLLPLENMDSYLSLFGMNDRNMAALEQELNVTASLRGQELVIQGAQEDAALGERVVLKLIDMLKNIYQLIVRDRLRIPDPVDYRFKNFHFQILSF